jgi:hypothetical protein
MVFCLPLCCVAQQQFEKISFYKIMDKGDKKAVEDELALLKESDVKGKMGYTGALLTLITDYENTEFHFLRLTVEEHAPRVVHYHSDIERDKSFIVANFKDLSPVVQKAILDYCRESKVLHAGDLQVQ